jgi:hypothetical protein
VQYSVVAALLGDFMFLVEIACTYVVYRGFVGAETSKLDSSDIPNPCIAV